MTPNIPPSFEIELSGKQANAEFVKMFLKNQSIRGAFEDAFGVRFNSNPIFEDEKVFVTCNAFDEQKENAIKAFEILNERFANGQRLDSSVVKLIADSVIRGVTAPIPTEPVETVQAASPQQSIAYAAPKKSAANSNQKHSSKKNKFNSSTSNNNRRDDRRSALGSPYSANRTPSTSFNQNSGYGVTAPPNLKRMEKYVYEPRSEKQRAMAAMIDNNSLVFGLGPAGTGKTHVAVAKAIMALQAGLIDRIVIARPALQAGEDLGFMKGDKNQKLEEYMRPIYDMFDKAFGPNVYLSLIENRVLDIVAVGQMRGRTFEKCYVILDEAQNCTKRQMYMALTRVGENVKMIVTGDPDPNQIDLQNIEDSGLHWAAAKLEGKPDIAQQRFEEADVVRSALVKTIVNTLGDDFKKNDFSVPAKKTANGGPKV